MLRFSAWVSYSIVFSKIQNPIPYTGITLHMQAQNPFFCLFHPSLLISLKAFTIPLVPVYLGAEIVSYWIFVLTMSKGYDTIQNSVPAINPQGKISQNLVSFVFLKCLLATSYERQYIPQGINYRKQVTMNPLYTPCTPCFLQICLMASIDPEYLVLSFICICTLILPCSTGVVTIDPTNPAAHPERNRFRQESLSDQQFFFNSVLIIQLVPISTETMNPVPTRGKSAPLKNTFMPSFLNVLLMQSITDENLLEAWSLTLMVSKGCPTRT